MIGLRVLVVARTDAARAQLQRILEAERDIWVVHAAADVTSMPRLAREVLPDVITLDSAELAAGGLVAIEQLMAERPVPLLVLAELSFNADNMLVAQAIERGALDVQIRPTPSDHQGAARLRYSVRQMARVRVVRHLPAGSYAGPLPPLSAPPMLPGFFPQPATTTKDRAASGPGHRVVAFGGSAGAPSVLAEIVGRLPADFPACVTVVQHLPTGFSESFAGFLRTHTRLRVTIVRDQIECCAGTLLLPADDCHLVATSSETFAISRDAPLRGHRPAVDVLFRSLALHHAARAVGIILSGIGRDGCDGLQQMRQHGAFTMAQDERSAAVYGMPRIAKECGAAAVVLPPEEIAATLLQRLYTREPRV